MISSTNTYHYPKGSIVGTQVHEDQEGVHLEVTVDGPEGDGRRGDVSGHTPVGIIRIMDSEAFPNVAWGEMVYEVWFKGATIGFFSNLTLFSSGLFGYLNLRTEHMGLLDVIESIDFQLEIDLDGSLVAFAITNRYRKVITSHTSSE